MALLLSPGKLYMEHWYKIQKCKTEALFQHLRLIFVSRCYFRFKRSILMMSKILVILTCCLLLWTPIQANCGEGVRLYCKRKCVRSPNAFPYCMDICQEDFKDLLDRQQFGEICAKVSSCCP